MITAADKCLCEVQFFIWEIIEFAEPEIILNYGITGITFKSGNGKLIITDRATADDFFHLVTSFLYTSNIVLKFINVNDKINIFN